jgi:hypothetical protein
MDINVRTVLLIFSKKIFALFVIKIKQENGQIAQINSAKDGFITNVTST